MKNTEIPDVYNIYEDKEDKKLGIAHIPNLKISHLCESELKNNVSKRFLCRYNKNFKKWMPIETC